MSPKALAVRGGAAVGPIDEVRHGVSDPLHAHAVAVTSLTPSAHAIAATLDRRPWP